MSRAPSRRRDTIEERRGRTGSPAVPDVPIYQQTKNLLVSYSPTALGFF